jgi:hypothetical protein
MLERTLVKSLGWPEGRILVLAHEAGTRLAEMGLSREAILVWLDQVYAEPVKFVNDPTLSRLAQALLRPHHKKDVNRAKPPLDLGAGLTSYPWSACPSGGNHQRGPVLS